MSLTAQSFIAAALALACDVASIRAVDVVESAGNGFQKGGKVKILFEPHLFHRFTAGVFDADHPLLSHETIEGNQASYARPQHTVLAEAMALDAGAAQRATSWGRYQILGDNWHTTGHTSLDAFVAAMRTDEAAHLTAFVEHVKSQPRMWEALRARNWRGFAREYNGPAYERKGYHVKLEAAYAKWCRR